MFKFLGLEASSLDAESWPVEVGLAWPAEGRLEIRSSLIRPDEMWSLRAWSPASAAVHGIPLAELRQAPTAPEVARWVAGIVGDPPWSATRRSSMRDGSPASSRPRAG